MASLLRLARKAGRAHGNFLADQESYRRNRQNKLDELNQERWNFDKSIRQQQLDLAEDRFNMDQQNNTLRNQWEAARQQRLATDHANKLADRTRMIQWATADRTAKQADRTRVNRMQDYLFRQKQQTDTRNNTWADRKLQAFNRLPRQQQDSYVLGGGSASSVPRNTSNPKGGNTISDTRIENTAKNISPELARQMFDNHYEISDDQFEQMGTNRDRFMSDLSNAYAHHVRTKGKNAVPLQDFAYQYGKNHNLPSMYNMTNLFNSRGKDAQERNQTGFWSTIRNKLTDWNWRDTHEEDYSQANPRSYARQKQLILDVMRVQDPNSLKGYKGQGIPRNISAPVMNLLKNEEFLRAYSNAQRSGMDPNKVIQHYTQKQTKSGGKK